MDLNPGEIICDKCNGRGLTYTPSSKFSITGHMSGDQYKCIKCKGTGKLDWIENIVGKKKSFEAGYYKTDTDLDLSVFLNGPKILLPPGTYYIDPDDLNIRIFKEE